MEMHAKIGDPRLPARFWRTLEVSLSGCWLWLNRLDSWGYGQYYTNGKRPLAHRFAYIALVGPFPEGLESDHLCRVRHCVNPAHIEPVTRAENVRRGLVAEANRSRKGTKRPFCRRGHEMTPENTYLYPPSSSSFGRRGCHKCSQMRHAQYYEAKKARRRP